MAMNTQNVSNDISPEVVGSMFVEQYYHFLIHSPEVVFKFYHDQSVLSRPNANGLMTSTTTMQGINEKILSMGYKDYTAEIKTADAQKSHGDGVIVLVTGCLIGKNGLKRNFTQTFFLAPQDSGYFVLNDVFRYLEDAEPLETNIVNQTDDPPVQNVSEPVQVVAHPAPVPAVSSAHNVNVVEKTPELLPPERVENDKAEANESSVAVKVVSESKDKDTSSVGEPFSSTVPEDVPKKSYASIVSSESKMLNSHGKKASGSRKEKVYVPANSKKVAAKLSPEKTEKEDSESIGRLSVPEAPDTTDVATEINNQREEAEGHSIYIRNFPYDVTVAQVRAVFENFGPIKTDGIQVRCHKDVGHCFGFVEFQSVDSMIKAVEASPVDVGGRHVFVETKKTTSRAGMGRRFFQGRSAFHHENFRGRGNYSGNGGVRAYNRNEYGQRGDFSTHNGRMPPSRGGGYHRGRGGKLSQSNGQYHNPVPIPA